MAEARTYTGSCHCGSVRYEVTADISRVTACNCSHCQRNGWLLAFVPEAQFKLLTPQAPLTDYQFNKHVIHHLFCPTCGVHPFSRGSGKSGPVVSVNVRCLEGVELEGLTVTQFDGRSL
jgi:hypothetical protein